MPNSRLVFISHVAAEYELAARLKKAIDEAFLSGLAVFVSGDPANIPAGKRWFDQITTALTECQLLMVLASPRSVREPWINFEAGAVYGREIDPIPVMHSGMTVRDLGQPLSFFQAIEMTDATHLEHRLFARLAGVAGTVIPGYPYSDLATELGVLAAAIPAPIVGSP